MLEMRTTQLRITSNTPGVEYFRMNFCTFHFGARFRYTHTSFKFLISFEASVDQVVIQRCVKKGSPFVVEVMRQGENRYHFNQITFGSFPSIRRHLCLKYTLCGGEAHKNHIECGARENEDIGIGI